MAEAAPSALSQHRFDSARKRLLGGYLLLLCVVVLWTSSSFITNALFTSMEYNKPVFSTFLQTSSFALYLIKPGYRWLRACYRERRRRASSSSGSDADSVKQETRGAYAPVSSDGGGDDPEDGVTRSPSRDAQPSSSAASGPALDPHALPMASDEEPPLTTGETAKLALMFCTVWFAANVTINAALAHTSVSSVTILSSLSGLFTLIIGAIFGIERFNAVRLLAVAASIIGVVLVSKADNEIAPAAGKENLAEGVHALMLWARDAILPQEAAGLPLSEHPHTRPKHPILGDALAIASAACYAIYTLLLKAKTGDESRISMTLFFGFVGGWNILLFWPILVVLNYTGIEPFEWPHQGSVIFFLLLNASITFVSDMTMMVSMLMTSPLAVTLGLSLTIPLAVFGDILRGTEMGGMTLFCGAALVLGGFVAVGLADAQEKDEEIIEQILGPAPGSVAYSDAETGRRRRSSAAWSRSRSRSTSPHPGVRDQPPLTEGSRSAAESSLSRQAQAPSASQERLLRK